MNENKLLITPKTKVADLLQAYPELEEPLMDFSPEFKRLQNPILRKTIAKVTSLQQAAVIAGIPVEKIINKLRAVVGQDALKITEQVSVYLNEAPNWFDSIKIVKTFDATSIINSGGHPLSEVMNELRTISDGDIFELITPFIPAPLIDKIQDMGYQAWTKYVKENEFRNYFIKLK